ncbi:MAG: galactose mutarotase [Acidobacteria bacterium]|nr:galactose mutarotase [Acidobacteriota bacterium]
MDRNRSKVVILLVLLFALNACQKAQKSESQKAEAKPAMQKQSFGKTDDGQAIDLYTLTNKSGAQVAITNYGGAVVSLKVPDKSGQLGDVVLGYDTLDGYVKDKPFLGATIGRYGNRIGKGTFVLNGVTYHVGLNDGPNSLHGGFKGFNKQVFSAKEVSGAEGPALELTYLSKDGEEGYPGNLTATVTFTWTDNNELKIDYRATSDKDTVVNLTNHSYFNLAGQGDGDILGQQLTIYADRFTPVSSTLIPTGELRPVKGTPFDFTTATVIGARIAQDDEQLKFGRGYDHNWVLNAGLTDSLHPAAEVYEAKSGRVLQVFTTEPGVQFYTGNFLDGSITGKGGKVYQHRYALCLETQHFPDSPNHPTFPSTTLKAGQTYHTTTVYKFSTR